MVDKYNKLVRDKIPELIMQKDNFSKTELLDDVNYFSALNKKLTEEVSEYLENYNIEELADIVEVIYAIVKFKGINLSEFEDLRLKKYNERGGFDCRISLIEVERSSSK